MTTELTNDCIGCGAPCADAMCDGCWTLAERVHLARHGKWYQRLWHGLRVGTYANDWN